ncbi:ThrRS/AlaRS common domain-containing protein [Cyathus striatus]|nr:ThrRS/AlaRS common domain-containing protein [Cyathus striatus]
MATAILLPASTPQDYHRIVSPTLTIPSDPSISIPVGLLACQRDPLLRSLETTIVSCSVHQPPPSPAGKKSKKTVISPALPSDPVLEVILHDTVIFPEGGGQPTDTGLITTHPDGTIWRVVQAKRHGGHAVHYVRVETGDVQGAVLALFPGRSVGVSLNDEDYGRRYDHMSMHTSQHLLSALLETHLGLPTLSWSLTAYPSPCYVEVPRGMSKEEVSSIQDIANKLVFEGRRVHVEVQELDRQGEAVPKAESGREIGKGLPDDYTGGVKRVVVIDGVDRNPCCGTHLPSLYNLQLFLFPHTEALSRSSTTSARLYFLAGPRLIYHLTSTHQFLTDTAVTLSCGPPLVPERVNQVIEERKKAEKRIGDVEAELAGCIAKQLVNEMSTSTTFFKKYIHRTDDSGNVLGFLSSIASSVSNGGASISYIIILTSSPSSQSISSTTTVLVLGSEDAKVKHVGNELRCQLEIRGGGKGQRWSGKFNGVWKEAKEGARIGEILVLLE